MTPAAASQLVITTQPSATATAGVVFAQQPVVAEEDQFGNIVTSDSTHTVTAARGSLGTVTLLGSTLTVTLVNGVASFNGLSYNKAETMNIAFTSNVSGVTGATSSSVVVSPAGASQLVVTTQPSSLATAGAAFATQPVVAEEDPFGNVITSDSPHTVTAARGSQGTAALQGSTLTVTLSSGVATFSGLSYNKAETMNLAFTSIATGVTSATSNNVLVSSAAASQLVVTTQPSATATAGVTFAQQPVVAEEDQFGNVETGDSTHTVTAARGSQGSALLQGSTLTVTLSGGVASFSGLSYNKAETMNLAFTTNLSGVTSATSNSVVVNPAAASQLVITTQPSATATAGVAFSTQPVVVEEDQFNNIITSDSTHTVTAARGTQGTATLQGSPLTVTLVNGVATFNGLSYNKAETMNIGFSTNAGSFTATSSSVVVSPAAASQLVVTTQPSATATAGVVFATQPVVQEEDQFGNVITSDNTSTVTAARGSLGTALLQGSPLTVTLTSGVATFSGLFYNKAETMNLSFSTSASGVSSTTSTNVVVTAATASQLVITQQPSSPDTAGVAFPTQPVVAEEDQFGNIVTTDSTHTETAARVSQGTGTLQGSTLTVTLSSGVATFSGLSYNVAETMNLSFTTNATGVTAATSNLLLVTAATASQLVVTQQPSSTATAGVALLNQPGVKEEDAFGNVITTDSTHTVTAARGSQGTAALQGSTLTVTLTNGVATFSGLSYNKAETMNITFTTNAPSVTSATSANVVVSPAAASQLVVSTQPSATATAGVAFATQPVVAEEDPFGNVITSDSTHTVTAARGSLGTASLQGSTLTVTLASGVATFSGLSYNKAEAMNLAFTTNASGVTSATSNHVVVNSATASQLAVTTQPSATATAGVTFATQPVVAEEDNFGNTITTDSTHTVTVARGSLGTVAVQGSTLTVTLSSGVATFSGLSYNKAETMNLAFTTNASGVTSATSNSVVVSPAAASQLVITTQPSATATAGVAFATQPVVAEEDSFGNIITSDSTHTVTAARGSQGTATLQGGLTLTLSSGVATFSGLSYNKAETMNMSFTTNAGSFTATSNSIVVSPAAASKLVVTTQPSATATAGVAFVQQPVVAEEDSFGNTITSDSTHTVTVARGSQSTATLHASQLTVTLANGVATFTGLSYNMAETMNLAFTTNAGSFTATSNPIVVNPAAASQLVVTTQPSPTATAGVAFTTQPVVKEEDSFGNVITSDSTHTVTVARGSQGSAALQGSTLTVTLVSGVATFSGLSYNKAETMNIAFSTNAGAFTATSNSVVVSPATASQLVVTTQPSATATAGVNFVQQPVVAEEDSFGNIITTDSTHTVTVARGSQGTATLLGSPLTVTLTNGVASFSGLFYNKAETMNLAFSTNAGSFTATSSNVVVSPAAASQLVITTQPSSTATAGVAFAAQPVVAEEDQFGNTITTDNTHTVTVARGSLGTALLQGSTLTVTLSSGVATFSGLSYNKAETINLSFSTNAGSFTATSNSIVVSPAAASQLVLTTQPSATATAGVAFATQPVVAEEDSFGNTITTDNTHTVTVARGGQGTAALQGSTLTVTLSNGVASFSGLSYNKAETMNLAFSTNAGSFTATSNSVVVSPAAASQLVVNTQPSPTATAGVAFATQPVVAEEDAFGNVITSDNTHTVTAARGTQGTATLQGSLTLTLSNGVASFSGLSYNKAETMNIAFTTNAGSFTITSGSVVVSPAAASQLVVTTQPSATATAGVAFATQPVVTEEDSFGNTITTDNTHTVTVARGSLGTSTLQGSTLTVTLASGVATFSGLSYNKAETMNLAFTSNATGVTSATSTSVVVSPAAASQLVLTTQPSPTATAGVAFATQPVVAEEDSFGNIITSDSTHTVTVARGSQGTALLQGSNLTVILSSGVATFSGLSYNKAETINLAFTTNAPSVTSATSNNVVVSPAAASQVVLTTQPSPTATAGVTFVQQPVVAEEDSFGNIITSDSTHTVTVVRGSQGTSTLQGSPLTVTLTNGVATFSGLSYNKAETINLSFTTNAGSFTATSNSIVVSPAAASQLVVTTQPSATATAGVAFATQPVVAEEDPFGNVITSDNTHTVTVARGSLGTASLQGSTLTVTLTNGVATFSGLSYNKVEIMNLAFSTNAGTFTATSNSIVVSPAAASQLVVTTQPSATATAGLAFATQPVVAEEDSFGNVITSDSAHTVTVARGSQGTATLQGSTLTVTLASGVATFSGLSYNKAETMNLAFTTNGTGVSSATSNSIVVNPAAASQLVVTTQPSSTATAGVVFSTQPVVAEEDSFGNVITGDSAHTVTVARGSQGTATLQGSPLTVTLTNGVATFSGLSYNKAETMNIAFSTNAGSFTATSTSVVVSPAAASQLVLTTQPSATATAGVTVVTQPVVAEEDQFGNIITSDSTHTVTVARGTQGTATIQGGPLTVTLTNGVATFSGLSYNKAETMNLAFTTNARVVSRLPRTMS